MPCYLSTSLGIYQTLAFFILFIFLILFIAYWLVFRPLFLYFY